LDDKVERNVMDDRRNTILSIQESIAAAKGRAKVGSILDVLIEGRSVETEGVLEGRHQGLAPEIDGVVYIDEGSTDTPMQSPTRRRVSDPAAGDFYKIEITDAAGFDLVGRIITNPSN
jgi:ribosomal protein S12 methylthiotransferase